MKRTIFTGAGVALITPMNDDFTVNYDVLGDLIDYQIENNTDAIIICGTTGESAALSLEEHEQVIDFAVKRINKRVPLIAGTGSNDTKFGKELSVNAQKMGADALLLVTPYYNKTSQKGLIEHYTAIADEVDIPMILYNVPSRTGLNIAPETYAKLAEHQNICAIKEANGDISSAAKTMALCGDKIDMYSGNDDQVIPFLSLGAKGVISVYSNVAPAKMHKICADFMNGNEEEAKKLFFAELGVMNALFSDVNPIPVKEALNLMGMHAGPLRLPLTTMEEGKKEALKEILVKHNLIESWKVAASNLRRSAYTN